jgi:hypothetical protein
MNFQATDQSPLGSVNLTLTSEAELDIPLYSTSTLQAYISVRKAVEKVVS